MSEHEDDERLAAAFRAGLQHEADLVDISAPVVAPAGAAARRRRRGRVVMAVAAAGTAAALVTAVALQGDDPDAGRDDRNQVADSNPPDTEPLPSEWRTETWHGLTVEVPADWGWGTAPITMSFDPRTPLLCGGPGAMVQPDGKRLVNAADGTPWVGRPIMLSDACLGPPYPPPAAPYVWLGASVEPGTVDVGNGYTQETVEVAGTTLTVATRDDGLRRRIVDSAGAPESCAASLASPPAVDSMLTEGLRDPTSAQVCAYRREEGALSYDLVYATALGPEQAAAYHSQVYDGGMESSPEFCGEGDELVLITITGDDPFGSAEVSQATVVDPACREVSGSPGMVSPLSDAGMEAWSRNGVPVVLHAFIGILG
jgi:hypothetical protein